VGTSDITSSEGVTCSSIELTDGASRRNVLTNGNSIARLKCSPGCSAARAAAVLPDEAQPRWLFQLAQAERCQTS
jgi:hypothetical protein